ncbi:MAG: ketoacyl-ACP synthase III [Lactobacillales bacterium]|jgi:3-oxoacyl-[acyl-carrier-protein] synthase-3|nr:ketoacyl-ACP synthase III [Lactobacillales bacterium]
MTQFGKITATAHYVPERVVTNDDLAEIMETSDEWISSRTGIHARHITTSENTSDLCTQVAKQLLEKSGLSAEELDFIIVATLTPDSATPSTSCLVQGNIGAVNAMAFDINAACSGFIYALSTGEKLVQSGVYKKGIVIGGEVLSKIVDWNDRSTAVLFGDGAGGVVLEADVQKHIQAEKLQADGVRGHGLSASQTNPHSPFSENLADDRYLHMDGREIFDFAVRDVPKNILETLAIAEELPENIDYYLLHQANIRIIDKMARKIKADRAKFLTNIEKYGNTSAATIPILLSEAVEQGTIKIGSNQKLVLTGFGGGLTWGTLLITI